MTGSATRARAFLGAVCTVGAFCVWGSLTTTPPHPAAVDGAATAVAATTGPFGPVAPDTVDAAAPGAGTASTAGPAAPPTQGLRPVVFTTASPGQAAAAAVAFALHQIGLPYVWGGDGPAAGDAGFDCSGLTHAAYAAAGITLPRTAQTQYDAGPHLAADTPLQAGDLVFYGTPTHVHHVGIALDARRMVNAPTFGRPVQVASIRGAGDDYVGATRPAAGVGGPLLLPAPVAARIAAVPVTSGPPPAAPAVAAAAALPTGAASGTTSPVAAPATVPATTAPPTTAPLTATPPAATPITTAPSTTAPSRTATSTTATTTTGSAPAAVAPAPVTGGPTSTPPTSTPPTSTAPVTP